MSRTRFWCLTLNNYSEDDISSWSRVVLEGKAQYICWQQEIAPSTGTPHLQGYVVFPKTIRLEGVKKALGTRGVHAIRSNGAPSANRTYCSKEKDSVPESFREFGTLPEDPVRGTRNDFEDFKEAVKNGLRCKAKARHQFPSLTAKYPRWCYDILADQAVVCCEEHPLFEWQQSLNDLLEAPPNDRTIYFVVDHQGNQGKTWFAKQYVKSHVDSQYMEPGKKADMAYALQENIRVLFLNVTRTSDSDKTDKHEYLYSFIEAVKDGMVFSPKYESRTKFLGKVHVVVMMNKEPNRDLLSHDRYHIIDIK